MPPRKNDPKDPEHAKACLRSEGARRKLQSTMKYCKDTGYMGILCFKPTWTRGQPRAFKTTNWTGPVLVPNTGEIGEGVEELTECDEYLDMREEGDYEDHYHGDSVGSPRTRRPTGALNKKKKGNKNKTPARCHACGEVFVDGERDKWITCGGIGKKKKGCDWSAHTKCWNLQVPIQKLRDFCDRFVRCKPCQELEDIDDIEDIDDDISDGEEVNNSGLHDEHEEKDPSSSSEHQKKMSSGDTLPGTSNASHGRKSRLNGGFSNKSSRLNRGSEKRNSQRGANYSSGEEFA